uniref:Uncharacterized protein n=1 Tax=Tetranychus urticae TaxID=32264 RepID=T1KKI3_TETUR
MCSWVSKMNRKILEVGCFVSKPFPLQKAFRFIIAQYLYELKGIFPSIDWNKEGLIRTGGPWKNRESLISTL